ncbi:MAG: leader peptidase (prepilin peptidase) / N-methyltransferase [Actinomycetota bacterium]|jgi:leader peptidase (prepilin peptidase)/N-methyltransferase|nr:leader peptidase (prepilin peptidase) / N-methyltransferase [Actinomycetota bacterium]MDX6675485.1 leader peptidase (prepilin peptidase) / N-methyltransferase [Solirubrobacteraceae bacterium]
MPVAIAAVAGLLAGSFFNVVIARLPRHESLLRPRSRCPHCGHPVRPYDNVPVVSWLILRGRCRDCGESISARYPLVELLTAALFAAVVIDTGANEHVWLGLALVAVLVPVAFIDLDHRIIPNAIVLPGAVAAIAIVAATEPSELAEHLIAGAAAAGFLLVAVLAYPRGMGMGDVKLAGVLGLYLGRSVGPAMLVALLSGTIVGVVIIARKGAAEGRKTAVPFGPFLGLGGLVGLFFGPDIVDWYLDSFT